MSTEDVPIVSFLKELMRRRKRLPSQLAFDLGVSHATVSRWLSNKDIPNTRSCQRLVEYSGVPLEKVLSITGHLPIIAEKAPAEWPDDNKERLNRLLDERQFNLQSYDFIESEAKGLCRLCQLVEKLAQNYLEMRAACRPPLPMGLVTLFDKQHVVEVHQLPLKVYHGAIWHPKNEWIIQLKDSDTSAIKRFTLLHEAFHILAHCRTSPVFRKRGAIQGSFNELLADYFAICILMPRQWVKEKWAEVKDLDRMAEIFDVPKPAMGISLRRLGLI